MKPIFSFKKACLVCYLSVAVAFAPAMAHAQPSPTDTPAGPAVGETAKSKSASPITAAVRRMRRAAPLKSAPPAGAAPTPPAPPAPAPAAESVPLSAPPAATGGSTGTTVTSNVVELPGEKEFNSCKKLPDKRIVKLNLKPDTELSELIGWISSITCTQFLIPGTTNIQGKKITIISPQLITPREAYRLFLSAIESVGLTVEPSDRFLRIIETNRARFTQLPLLAEGEFVPSDKRYVTRMVRLKHLDAADVTQNVLQRLKGEQGDIIAYQGDTLIITDQGAMIRKMIEVLERLDQPRNNDERIWMVRVVNSTAIEMAARLAEVFNIDFVGQGTFKNKAGGAPAPRPAPAAKPAKGPLIGDMPELQEQMQISRLIPVDRTNQLIIVAKPLAYEWLKVMIDRLDVQLERDGDDRVHMYYCNYANCDELAVTVGAVTGIAVSIPTAGRTTGGGSRSTPAATPRPPTANGQQQEIPMFDGDVRINFDRPTNALVIMSSLKDYQQLRKILQKLDSPRKQVFIEALILEVLLNKSRKLGNSFHGGAPVDTGTGEKSLLIGGFQAASTLLPAGLLGGGASGPMAGLGAGLFGAPLKSEDIRIFGGSAEIPSFGVFLQAVQNNDDVNVLSNPYIIITNNDEGELSVGSQLPFPGTTAGLGGGLGGAAGALGGAAGFLGGLGASVNRTKVALSLKLVPSVNEHNMIRMEVEAKIEDVLSQNYNGLGPATSLREAKTTVNTRDQQTVLLGGLMSDRNSENVTKVPILGDIPILGFFFRSTTTSKQKSNIIIALTPYVISEPGDLRRIAEKKMRERREFIERYTAFRDTASLESDVDYSKKRGLLAEINRSVLEIESEESEMRDIRKRDSQDRESPIEPPSGVKWSPVNSSRPLRSAMPTPPTPPMESPPQSFSPPIPPPAPEAQAAPPAAR
jgi:general secretion pathway protein D